MGFEPTTSGTDEGCTVALWCDQCISDSSTTPHAKHTRHLLVVILRANLNTACFLATSATTRSHDGYS